MTFDELMARLREAKKKEEDADQEIAHLAADEALVEFVSASLTPEQRTAFGAAWEDIGKWYA